MEIEKVLDVIKDEVRFLESKADKVKRSAAKHSRYLHPHERAQIQKFSSQQMVLRKVARKIQKLNTV